MKISFIGHGRMAKAMIAGILKSGLIAEKDICCTDIGDDNQKAIDFADYIFLTVKPQVYREVLSAIKFSKEKVFITVAPGIKTSGIPAKVIRTMPNTPALIGCGVTAICRNALVSDEEYEKIKTLFATFSKVYELPESLMDEVVALSGSSPAYFYLFIKAISDYSATTGIDYQTALMMAAQTAIGAATMIIESGLDPLELTDQVCSKKGTTIEAVKILKEKGLAETVAQAMAACSQRAKELAEENNKK